MRYKANLYLYMYPRGTASNLRRHRALRTALRESLIDARFCCAGNEYARGCRSRESIVHIQLSWSRPVERGQSTVELPHASQAYCWCDRFLVFPAGPWPVASSAASSGQKTPNARTSQRKSSASLRPHHCPLVRWLAVVDCPHG